MAAQASSTTKTTTTIIHTQVPAGTPLAISIPILTSPATPSLETIVIPAAPPATPVAITSVIPVVLLTDAVFTVMDPFGGQVELFTLHQTAANQPVFSTITLSQAPTVGGTTPNAATPTGGIPTSVGLGSPPLGISGVSISSSLTAALMSQSIISTTHSNTLPTSISSQATGLRTITGVSTSPSGGNATSSNMPAAMKSLIIVVVMISVLLVAFISILVLRWRRNGHHQLEDPELTREERIEEQKRRAEATAWRARVVMPSGAVLTASDMRRLVDRAQVEFEETAKHNREKAADDRKQAEECAANTRRLEKEAISAERQRKREEQANMMDASVRAMFGWIMGLKTSAGDGEHSNNNVAMDIMNEKEPISIISDTSIARLHEQEETERRNAKLRWFFGSVTNTSRDH